MTNLLKVLFASSILFPVFSYAHHSFFGRFDMDNSIIMEGVVTEIHWRNPHVHIFVDITDENGEITNWDMESGSPTLMRRAGIPRDALQIGQTIQAAVYPPLTDRLEAFATNVLLPSGQELVMQTGVQSRFNDQAIGDFSYRFRTEGDRSHPELGLFRVWTFTGTYGFLFPESINRNYDLYTYPMTDAAKEVLGRFNPATDNPTQNCAIKGMPLIMEQPVPMEIVQQGENVLLRLEEYDLIRTINMDREAAPENQEYSILGYSVGRWEGETLVTTTTHINYPWFNQSGIPLSIEASIVERFTAIEDGSLMEYEMEVTDPVNFTETVFLSKTWLHVPELEVLPFECKEAETD